MYNCGHSGRGSLILVRFTKMLSRQMDTAPSQRQCFFNLPLLSPHRLLQTYQQLLTLESPE